jgi:hypothetical protein
MLQETLMNRKPYPWLLIPTLALAAGVAYPQITPSPANTKFQDVLQTGPGFSMVIQLAGRLGLAVPAALGPCLNTSSGILPPGGISGEPSCPYFGPDTTITRAEAAYWIVRSQADENQITQYLCATGGDPSGLASCPGGGIGASTFADLGVGGASIVNPFVSNHVLGVSGVYNAQLMRYIEVMARRGYTKGCAIDPLARYCPNNLLNRAQIAVFVIRAKMNNVFPTSLSGAPLTPLGDNFSAPLFPYFTDVVPTDPLWGPYFIYIQKMRELAITLGTTPTTFSPGNLVTRKEIAAFVVRAFFQ